MYQIISPKEMRSSLWSGGITHEIYLYPPSGSYANREFSYRISSAEIASEHSIFTPLPLIARILVNLRHNIRLQSGAKDTFVLKPFEPFYFMGSEKTESWGATTDFNIMLQGQACARLQIFSLEKDSTQKIMVRSINELLQSPEIIQFYPLKTSSPTELHQLFYLAKGHQVEIKTSQEELLLLEKHLAIESFSPYKGNINLRAFEEDIKLFFIEILL